MVELAERLVASTPRADLVVFGKNGADATSWAVDVARAHTGRPRIARVAGAYHGARPWTMPRLPGVPAQITVKTSSSSRGTISMGSVVSLPRIRARSPSS